MTMSRTNDNDPHTLARSKDWFVEAEENRCEDVLVRFRQAKRLGRPKSGDAILICKKNRD